MKPIEKRVKALEQDTGPGVVMVLRVVFHNVLDLDDILNGRAGWLGHAKVIPVDGGEGSSLERGEGETRMAFLERVAAVYEPIHGPVPGDWYEDRRDAA